MYIKLLSYPNAYPRERIGHAVGARVIIADASSTHVQVAHM
jgi:hypothetical protein